MRNFTRGKAADIFYISAGSLPSMIPFYP